MKQGAKYFVNFLLRLLKWHYNKIDPALHLYLCRKLNGNWDCLSEDERLGEEIIKAFSDFDKGTVPGSISEKETDQNVHVVYGDRQNEFYDSRIDREYDQCQLYWMWTADEKIESIRFILKIFTDEMKNKIRDALYLERLQERAGQLAEKFDEEITRLKDDTTYRYFFGNLMDKDWIIRQYVELSLAEYGLPEWRMFLQISAMFYEKRTISTCMYFLEEHNNISDKFRVEFAEGGSVKKSGGLKNENLRTIRKLMEMSGPNHGLVLRKPDYSIEGIVYKKDFGKENIRVEFTGYLIWRLKKNSEIIFEYREGKYRLPELELKDDSKRELRKLKKLPCQEDQKNKIYKAIKKVRKASTHGTSIVFMDNTTLSEEVKRLAGYCRVYKTEEFDLKKCVKNLPEILAIDGALLVGMDCRCRAVGVIVDGEAQIKGRADRGARYNSLMNYIHVVRKREISNPKRGSEGVLCCAVVISEDGMIDVKILSDTESEES